MTFENGVRAGEEKIWGRDMIRDGDNKGRSGNVYYKQGETLLSEGKSRGNLKKLGSVENRDMRQGARKWQGGYEVVLISYRGTNFRRERKEIGKDLIAEGDPKGGLAGRGLGAHLKESLGMGR